MRHHVIITRRRHVVSVASRRNCRHDTSCHHKSQCHVTNFVLFFKLLTTWKLEVCYKNYAPTCAAERRIFLGSLKRWKKAENNSNLLQCNIELKILETIIALTIEINKTLCNSLY